MAGFINGTEVCPLKNRFIGSLNPAYDNLQEGCFSPWIDICLHF